MNNQIKIGLLMIVMATVATIGEFTLIPSALSYLVVSVLMGWLAFIYLGMGQKVNFVGTLALSGCFLTVVLSSILPVSLLPLTLVLLVIGGFGGVYSIVSGFRN